jgi:hypothetical protein
LEGTMTIECPKCQTKNPDTVKFCGECGTPLPQKKDAVPTKTMETPVTSYIKLTHNPHIKLSDFAHSSIGIR